MLLGVETGSERFTSRAEWVIAERAGGRHSSALVRIGPCQFGRVAGPVASGLAHPADGGAWSNAQQVGEDGVEHLGGEVGDRVAAACHGVDAKGAQAPAEPAGVIGRPAGNSHADAADDPFVVWVRHWVTGSRLT
jgi:hypothetical protein